MKKLSTFSGDEAEKYRSQMRNRQETIMRLRHQARRASLLLFFPWLLSVVFCLPMFRNEPASMWTLLFGLAVAFHIQRNLFHHLPSNHRGREEDELFPTLGAANWLTLLRAGAVVALAGLLPMAIYKSQGIPYVLSWAPGIIYLGISLADLLDGIVARKEGQETELGKKLDIETDAAGLMVASILAVALGRLPVSYLLVGLAYYFFILGIWMRQKKALPVARLQSRPYARIIAGFQMGLVGMALLPTFNPVFTRIAGLIFMTPLLLGFARDWLVVSCRLKTDADQQSRLDHWAGAIAMKMLALLLRLAIAAGGIMTLNTYPVYQTHL
ncbi:MAG: CDP-alcohol phosphatidyltransferase family protein, partial [Desulfobacterales bacterium]|nr:CDP-alcohol phosphatidyltransferase family protein [Desulfobacterales bacterium]